MSDPIRPVVAASADSSVTTIDELREVYPPPAERSLAKQQDHLDEHCRNFIALSPFVLVSTASSTGACDVSPKGGPPGFVRVLDDHRLLIPDATGNRRLDGMQNIVENPQVGLLFLIPGMGETLRVNGRVELTTDPAWLADLETAGRPAQLALIVEAREVFLHCAKALIRSKLWDASSWPAADQLPSAAAILNDHIGIGDLSASADALTESYTNRI
jgi:PPOX class probable FMN-dependent enzyme